MTDKLKEYPEKSYNTFTMKIIVMGTLTNDAKNVFFCWLDACYSSVKYKS